MIESELEAQDCDLHVIANHLIYMRIYVGLQSDSLGETLLVASDVCMMSVVITSRFMAVQNSSELQVQQQAAAASEISEISNLENAVQNHGYQDAVNMTNKARAAHF